MPANPYASPAMVTDAEPPTQVESSLALIAKPVFLAWERLRLIYVWILVVVSAVLIGPSGFMNPRVLFRLFEGAVAANVLFFAGPIVETYVHWLGFRQNWLRWVLFFSGTLLSVALALGVLLTGRMLEFD